MLTRKTWPVALSVIFVGSVAVIVRSDDSVPPAKPAVTSSGTGDVTPARSVNEEPGNSTASEARKPVKPKELSEVVKKGLEYLIRQQHEDGGFGQGGGWRLAGENNGGRVEGKEVKDPPDVGNTCMAALALIRAGSTPKAGKYSAQLVKAIEFIEKHVEAADKDSLYVTPVRDTQLQSKIGRYVDTFLTALVLSELKGQMPDKKSEDRLFAALNKTIGKIESNQQADGTFAGNAGWASVLSQGICSKALSRASQNGVAVKADTIKRDLEQTVSQLAPGKPSETPLTTTGTSGISGPAGRASAGGVAAAKGDAGVELYSLSANVSRVQDTVNSNQLRKSNAVVVINCPTADNKSKDLARAELREVEAVEKTNGVAARHIVANLGNDRFLKGFGNNGGEEFLSYMNISEALLAQGGEAWEKWDRQITETVSKVQNEDGSWSGHHCITGRTFCTSAALLTMLADRAPLPVADMKPVAK